MPLTNHQLDATDLLEQGTYALRRALGELQDLSEQLAAEEAPEGTPSSRSPAETSRTTWPSRAMRGLPPRS